MLNDENWHKKLLASYLDGNDFGLVCIKTWHSGCDNVPGVHLHEDFYELVIVIEGTAVHETETTRSYVSAGSVLLIPPQKLHTYRDCDNLHIFNLLFREEFEHFFLPELTQLEGFNLLFHPQQDSKSCSFKDGIRISDTAFPAIVEVFNDMCDLHNDPIPGNRTLLLGDFMRAIVLISRHNFWSNGLEKNRYTGPLVRLLNDLDNRYAQPWTLARMAARCRMSMPLFCVEFKRYTGFSPGNYLLTLRLKKAATLLTARSFNLDTIARQCGFNDVSYFSRQFKRHYNVAPSFWR